MFGSRKSFLAAISLASLGFASVSAGLAGNNPFLWPDFEPPDERAVERRGDLDRKDVEYEFHAVYELGDSTHVLVRDVSLGRFQWLTLGRKVDGIVAKAYDPSDDRLLIERPGGAVWLDLQGAAQAARGAISASAPQRRASARRGESTASEMPGAGIPTRGLGRGETPSREDIQRAVAAVEQRHEEEAAASSPLDPLSARRRPSVAAPAYEPEPPPFLRRRDGSRDLPDRPARPVRR